MKELTLLLAVILMSASCGAFYKPFNRLGMKKIIPKTLEELKEALCTMKNGTCDDESREIIIKYTFNFTDSEGFKTETGCYHLSKPEECKERGQLKLNINHQCDGLEATEVTYSVAGRQGLDVGSNKVIKGVNGGTLVGKGLMMTNVTNVEIRNLRITDINPRVIWGGDAIDIKNGKNILIDGCYIKNIGRQMIVTHFGSNTGILVRNSVFDGNTPFSAYCNGRHYWLWLFIGSGDQVAVQNNVVFHTDGRGPHLYAQPGSKALLHLIQNTFYDVKEPGIMIEQEDLESSILAEGNVIYNVTYVVYHCSGHCYLPTTDADAELCKTALGRKCLINTVVQSGNATSINGTVVLEDFKKVKKSMIHPIVKNPSVIDQVPIPDNVRKLITWI